MRPAIAELHRTTSKGQRPAAKDLMSPASDALSAAGIEVTILPPIQAHGSQPPIGQ